jgi:hypothetical protein
MPIFLVFDNSLSPILVWTQLPITEVSVSAVLALLAVLPVATLAAVEPLLPIAAALSKNSTGMEMREKCRWSGARGRRWQRRCGVNSYPSAVIFIPLLEIVNSS